MNKQGCWCLDRCHRCEKRGVMLYKCAGCEHRFCFTCIHRLECKWACVPCMSVWIGMMCTLELPDTVRQWFNQVTL